MWLYLSFILQSPWRVYYHRLGSQSESNPAYELTCPHATKYILTYKEFSRWPWIRYWAQERCHQLLLYLLIITRLKFLTKTRQTAHFLVAIFCISVYYPFSTGQLLFRIFFCRIIGYVRKTVTTITLHIYVGDERTPEPLLGFTKIP